MYHLQVDSSIGCLIFMINIDSNLGTVVIIISIRWPLCMSTPKSEHKINGSVQYLTFGMCHRWCLKVHPFALTSHARLLKS